jgi:Arc/MetJ-type ribon-helix-helix transcriptional regulator
MWNLYRVFGKVWLAVVIWKLTRNINLLLPEELLVEIDEAAKQNLTSRSEYIRVTLRKAIAKRQPDTKYRARGNEAWRYDVDDS